MERFFAEPAAWSEGAVRVTGEELRHLKQVLRLTVGERVEVFDGAGRGAVGTLTAISREAALVAPDAPVTAARDSALQVYLGQGLPKGEKMDWVVQKAAELGAAAVLPLELSRCIPRLTGEKKRLEKQARWQKIAGEAARQCGRLRLPEVTAPLDLPAFLGLIQPGDLLLIPWEEGGRPLRDFFAETAGPPGGRVFVLIGPEGGMTAREVAAGRQAGGRVLTLGPRLLRTETAGPALLAILQYQWGDMGGAESARS